MQSLKSASRCNAKDLCWIEGIHPNTYVIVKNLGCPSFAQLGLHESVYVCESFANFFQEKIEKISQNFTVLPYEIKEESHSHEKLVSTPNEFNPANQDAVQSLMLTI